ncbi:MAG: cupin domain-containing protein [Candidatus Pacebacteria bacterium]|nr:cupin domain-containing protein [Candidatus Paceibacterota bacterium]
MIKISNEVTVAGYLFGDNGVVPNSALPVVVYRNAVLFINETEHTAKQALASIASTNRWRADWVESNAVYRYTHYHSTAHEMLIVLSGSAEIRFGGSGGKEIRLSAGDAVAIPAGVAHRRINGDHRFTVAGLYPYGQKWDLKRQTKSDYNTALKYLPLVKLPLADPLYGTHGPLMRRWK